MSSQWSQEEIEYLKNNYKYKTYKELAQDLGRSKAAVDLKINRLGFKKSKYTYDHNYFETINTSEKAYWLGFIFADGSISIQEHTNSCELSIKLQKSDADHLRKFNKSINGNVDVSLFERKSNFNDKIYGGCQIRIYSEKMTRDLMKYGLHPNKSLAVKFPSNIEDRFMSHFIRGFFDGDGCIAKSNHKNGKSYIRADFTCGSIDFIKKLRKYLYKNGISSYVTQEEGEPYRLMIGGMKNSDIFFSYIYQDATIYLDRKYDKLVNLYKSLDIEQRLLRRSEMVGFSILNGEENGKAEMLIRVEG